MSTGNIVTTQDSATNYTNEMSKMFGLSHQGVAGASNLGFDTVNNTHQDSQNSATSSILDNGVFGVGSASGSGNAGSSGAGSNGNVFTTNDHAVNFDSQMIKSFDFSHQGVAGSSNLAFGTANLTHADSQQSSTLANISDGVFGVGGSNGSGSSGTGAGSNGNVFTTNDHAMNFDNQMIKSFDFSHQGVAGSSNLAFGIENTTHSTAASSATSASFGDGVAGNSALLDSLLHMGGTHSLLG